MSCSVLTFEADWVCSIALSFLRKSLFDMTGGGGYAFWQRSEVRQILPSWACRESTFVFVSLQFTTEFCSFQILAPPARVISTIRKRFHSSQCQPRNVAFDINVIFRAAQLGRRILHACPKYYPPPEKKQNRFRDHNDGGKE